MLLWENSHLLLSGLFRNSEMPYGEVSLPAVGICSLRSPKLIPTLRNFCLFDALDKFPVQTSQGSSDHACLQAGASSHVCVRACVWVWMCVCMRVCVVMVSVCVSVHVHVWCVWCECECAYAYVHMWYVSISVYVCTEYVWCVQVCMCVCVCGVCMSVHAPVLVYTLHVCVCVRCACICTCTRVRCVCEYECACLWTIDLISHSQCRPFLPLSALTHSCIQTRVYLSTWVIIHSSTLLHPDIHSFRYWYMQVYVLPYIRR